jgi:hypothetical protein
MNTGLDAHQLYTHVIMPALSRLEPFVPNSREARTLVLGTAITESRLIYLDQIDKAGKPGPAYGLWQMEALTYRDVISRVRPEIKQALSAMFAVHGDVTELHGNLFLGAAMCRAFYYLTPETLPVYPQGMAQLWKKRYNTYLGAGTVEKALPAFELAATIGAKR